MTTGKAARILSRCRVWSCPPRGRGGGLGPSQLSSPAAPAVSSASGARRARRASSPPVVLVAKGTVVASDGPTAGLPVCAGARCAPTQHHAAAFPACAPCAHREHHSCVLSSRAHACTHPAHERAPRCCVQQQVRGAHPRTAQHHAAAWPACARVCAPRAPCAHREVHTVAEKGPAAAPACCDPRAAGLLTSACTCRLQLCGIPRTQSRKTFPEVGKIRKEVRLLPARWHGGSGIWWYGGTYQTFPLFHSSFFKTTRDLHVRHRGHAQLRARKHQHGGKTSKRCRLRTCDALASLHASPRA